MSTRKTTKKASSNTATSAIEKIVFFYHVTIQEPKPGKFKIVPGEHDGSVWDCATRFTTTIETAKKDFLKSIKKTSASFLTQEEIDDFLRFIKEAGFIVRMTAPEWKKNFARRFQRFLRDNEITLEQIEQQGFHDVASKRWLRNLYKNGICTMGKANTMGRMSRLCEVLGVENADGI